MRCLIFTTAMSRLRGSIAARRERKRISNLKKKSNNASAFRLAIELALILRTKNGSFSPKDRFIVSRSIKRCENPGFLRSLGMTSDPDGARYLRGYLMFISIHNRSLSGIEMAEVKAIHHIADDVFFGRGSSLN